MANAAAVVAAADGVFFDGEVLRGGSYVSFRKHTRSTHAIAHVAGYFVH